MSSSLWMLQVRANESQCRQWGCFLIARVNDKQHERLARTCVHPTTGSAAAIAKWMKVYIGLASEFFSHAPNTANTGTPPMDFHKFQGCGNDFVVVDCLSPSVRASATTLFGTDPVSGEVEARRSFTFAEEAAPFCANECHAFAPLEA
jgi:hypothetical protein